MKIRNTPFTITDWEHTERVPYPGETGTSFWRVFEGGNIRVRIVEYSPGFKADHWCSRGHVLFVLRGALTIRLKDGSEHSLKEGTSFQVQDDEDNPHLALSPEGASVFIVD